jgi:opacity protein-like surface antigen
MRFECSSSEGRSQLRCRSVFGMGLALGALLAIGLLAAGAQAQSSPPGTAGAASEPASGRPASEAGPPSEASLAESVRRAEAAVDEAWLAARAAQRSAEKDARIPRQTGPYVGGAIAYAAENFDDSIIVKSSVAGAAFIGYRLIPFFATEIRYEGFDGFDLKARNGHGKIDGYAITLNARFYPFEGPLQPFMGFGVGGIRLEQNIVLDDGSRIDESDSDAVFRFFGGIDLPITQHVIINFEVGYLAPTDDLSDLSMTVMGGGLTYLF